MINEIARQEFIDQLNKANDYAQKNGLSYGICAWVGDAFEDADKEPFDKENPPWHPKNTEFFMKTCCYDETDRVEKLTVFIVNTLHDGLEPGLCRSWSKFIQDKCKKSAAKFITDSSSDCDKCDGNDYPNNPNHK